MNFAGAHAVQITFPRHFTKQLEYLALLVLLHKNAQSRFYSISLALKSAKAHAVLHEFVVNIYVVVHGNSRV